MRTTSRFVLLGFVLILLAFPLALRAEEDCSGPTYTSANCSNACPQASCVDISPGQDLTLFQCCPPEVPELPPWMGPWTLALLLVMGMIAISRFRPKLGTGGP